MKSTTPTIANYLRRIRRINSTNSFQSDTLSMFQAPSTPVRLFLKKEIFLPVLAFRPQVNGVFVDQKRQFSKTVPRLEIVENAG